MTIKLSDITPAPWNPRGDITPESVAGLAESIREQGLLQPIVVWKDGEGRWLCVAGNRRLAAMKACGYEPEEADTVIFTGDANEARLITVTENLQREGVSPIEEAALVAQCLDAGMTAEEIAAHVGRSEAWVSRRRRLLTLDDAWKREAGRFATLALETIAAYPAEVQKRAAADCKPESASWELVRRTLERESRNIDEARFDKAECAACADRTGATPDLFGEVPDGCLGSCMNRRCYERRERERIDALIAEATNGASEIVRLRYAWEMPRESESGEKRSKKHPCAYVHEYNGDVTVRWGESPKAAKAKAEAKADAANAVRNEASERLKAAQAVEAKLDECFDSDGKTCPDGLVGEVQRLVAVDIGERAARFAADAVCGRICEWHDAREWAEIVRSLDFVPRLAGLTEAEVAALYDYADNGNN